MFGHSRYISSQLQYFCPVSSLYFKQNTDLRIVSFNLCNSIVYDTYNSRHVLYVDT